MTDSKFARIGSAKGPASLGAHLLRRTGILSTLLLDQIEPDRQSLSDDFELWLRFVLTPEQAERFGRWSLVDLNGREEFKVRYQRTFDEVGVELLLRDVRRRLDAESNRGTGDHVKGDME